MISRGEPISPVNVDKYEDYIRYLEKESDPVKELEFWTAYLNNCNNAALLPFVRTQVNRNKGVESYREVVLEVDESRTQKALTYCHENYITINTLMEGIWACLLSRYTGNEQVVFGITVSGRPERLKDVEHRVGMYTNTNPLNVTLQGEDNIGDWLKDLQKRQLTCRKFQNTSLNDIISWVNTGEELFDTMLTFQNYPVSKLAEAGSSEFHVAHVSVNEKTTNYPLAPRIMVDGKITVQFIYKEEALDSEYVKKISGHFENILKQTGYSATEWKPISLGICCIYCGRKPKA
jgi:hypothetical protein